MGDSTVSQGHGCWGTWPWVALSSTRLKKCDQKEAAVAIDKRGAWAAEQRGASGDGATSTGAGVGERILNDVVSWQQARASIANECCV